MPESLSEDARRKIIEEGGMSVDSYEKTTRDTEQEGLDKENFRNWSRFWFENPARPEDVKAKKIKEVRVSSGQSTVSDVQPLTPAGFPLATRTRRTKGRGTKSRAKEVHSMDNHLRHSCWSPALS